MQFNKLTLMALATTALIAMAPVAHATDKDDTNKFVKKATISNMFEIESSKVALEKSQDAEVKAFANQMIADHTKAGDDMKAALMKDKYDMDLVPKTLDDKHQGKLKDLQESKDFNDDYINAQVKAHKDAVSLFSDYSKKGKDPVLKQFASKTLPTLKMHKQHIMALDDKK